LALASPLFGFAKRAKQFANMKRREAVAVDNRESARN